MRSNVVSPPVYDPYFADPFIFQHQGTYYAVGTGPGEAAGQSPGEPRAIPLLKSSDLVQWKFVHLALRRPGFELGDEIWAPEVACHAGRFYMYYSVGFGDKNHQLRVAVADEPAGPYRDLAGPLIDPAICPFAIDPHPYQDEDGQWYLFYARDFLDFDNTKRAGTALAVDRLIDMTRLAGQEQTVMRAKHDWQRFKSNRPMYGRIFDWHTLEGPSVRKYQEKYYCFYSGGNWETDNYGVDYVSAERITGPYTDTCPDSGPRVLRTIPNQLIGPGHNSILCGHGDENDRIIYHAWDLQRQKRRMHIDQLVWTSDGPRCPVMFGEET